MSEVRAHNSGGAHSKGNTNYSPNLTHTGGVLVCVGGPVCKLQIFNQDATRERVVIYMYI